MDGSVLGGGPQELHLRVVRAKLVQLLAQPAIVSSWV